MKWYKSALSGQLRVDNLCPFHKSSELHNLVWHQLTSSFDLQVTGSWYADTVNVSAPHPPTPRPPTKFKKLKELKLTFTSEKNPTLVLSRDKESDVNTVPRQSGY